MMTWPFPIFFLLSVSNALEAVDDVNYTGIIQTRDGPLRGTFIEYARKWVQQYLGVPYAKPPLNDLRFRLTQRLEKRNETLTADTVPPACFQYNEFPYPWKDNRNVQSEDCLYLNLWAPAKRNYREPHATIVWIHGGGFSLGSGSKEDYQGHVLAALDDVIIVTFNYRLGPFGFFTTNTRDAPGNVAIYDMVAVLKWLRWNIHYFGGSINNVTLAGQGSGAVAVGLLCVSPLATDYFQRVIMQSGSPAYLLAEHNDNILRSQHLADALGCASPKVSLYEHPKDILDCMKHMDPMRIVRKIYSFYNTSDTFFLPNYGDAILPENARKRLIAGRFHKVPVFFGTNRNEGAIRLAAFYPKLFGIHGELEPQINKTYAKFLMMHMFETYNYEKISDFYLGKDVHEHDYKRIRLYMSSALGDFHTLCPMQYFAEAYSKAGQDVFSYHFIHRPEATDWASWMEAVQYQEVPFFLGTALLREDDYNWYELLMSKRMSRYWTKFGIFGKPSDYDEWPTHHRLEKKYKTLDIKLGLIDMIEGSGPHKNYCEFWRSNFGFDRH